MNFEEAYQKFLDGTASPEETEFVRTEIKKAKKVLEVSEANEAVVNEAETKTAQKAVKRFNLKLNVKITAIVLAVLIVIAAAVLGGVFGAAASNASKNTAMDESGAQLVIRKYAVEKKLVEVSTDIWFANTEKELVIPSNITSSYYKYEIEFGFRGSDGMFYEYDAEIDGRSGAIIFIKQDR